MREPLRREGPAHVLQQELPTSLTKGTIVDLETTDLTPSRGGVICIGTIRSSTLEIRTRARDAKFRSFYDSLKGFVRDLPRPFYAYNASFDAKFLRSFLGYGKKELVVDLFEPWRSRAEVLNLKWPSLDELVTGPFDELPRDPGRDVDRDIVLPLGALREDEEAWLRRGRHERIPRRVRRVTGKEIPALWKRYVERDDLAALDDIVLHNRQDLLKALALLLFLE